MARRRSQKEKEENVRRERKKKWVRAGRWQSLQWRVKDKETVGCQHHSLVSAQKSATHSGLPLTVPLAFAVQHTSIARTPLEEANGFLCQKLCFGSSSGQNCVGCSLRCFYKSHECQNAQHSTEEANLVSRLRCCALISLSEPSSSTSLKGDLILKREGFNIFNAAVTNYHKLRGIKEHKFIFL